MTLFSQRPLLLHLACCLTRMACDDDRIHNICSQSPTLCEDLVDDGWCRHERSDVIRARYYLQEEGSDRRQYELMRGLERYLQCAEHSTNIEYKRAREQKSPRVEGMLAAGRQLEQLLSLDQILIPCAIRSLAARKPSSLLCRASQPSQRAPQLAIPVRLLSIKPPSLAIAM